MRLLLSVAFLAAVPVMYGAAPSITSVVNSASYTPGTLAPGSLGTIFGSSLATATAIAPGFPLPATLGSATVYLNDLPAPVLYVSPTQINFQVPWTAAAGTGSVVVIASGSVSAYSTVQIAPSAPGLFDDVRSSAWGVAQPVHAGEYITIYGTGLGGVNNPPATGASLPDAALSTLQTTPTVTIGGVQATVAFAGLAPPGQNPFYSAGVYQINALVAPNTPVGQSVPLIVNTGGTQSNSVNVSVASGTAASIARFLVLGPNGSIIARAITSETTCPLITIDGVAQTMTTRSAPTLPFYPVLSCETSVPATAKAVSIEGQALNMPVTNPQRVTVIGDTGCRMDTSNSQACNDPKAWPLTSLAANAIATNPQLLIHNGDWPRWRCRTKK